MSLYQSQIALEEGKRSMLSPLLFLLYVIHIASSLLFGKLVQCADDMTLFSK
ncbi:hypothetical protein J6590_077951 [Homalodisca vitripennis]|nr:hypothetical protein J6590_077951 [Homalodisca vitripennis]